MKRGSDDKKYKKKSLSFTDKDFYPTFKLDNNEESEEDESLEDEYGVQLRRMREASLRLKDIPCFLIDRNKKIQDEKEEQVKKKEKRQYYCVDNNCKCRSDSTSGKSSELIKCITCKDTKAKSIVTDRSLLKKITPCDCDQKVEADAEQNKDKEEIASISKNNSSYLENDYTSSYSINKLDDANNQSGEDDVFEENSEKADKGSPAKSVTRNKRPIRRGPIIIVSEDEEENVSPINNDFENYNFEEDCLPKIKSFKEENKKEEKRTFLKTDITFDDDYSRPGLPLNRSTPILIEEPKKNKNDICNKSEDVDDDILNIFSSWDDKADNDNVPRFSLSFDLDVEKIKRKEPKQNNKKMEKKINEGAENENKKGGNFLPLLSAGKKENIEARIGNLTTSEEEEQILSLSLPPVIEKMMLFFPMWLERQINSKFDKEREDSGEESEDSEYFKELTEEIREDFREGRSKKWIDLKLKKLTGGSGIHDIKEKFKRWIREEFKESSPGGLLYLIDQTITGGALWNSYKKKEIPEDIKVKAKALFKTGLKIIKELGRSNGEDYTRVNREVDNLLRQSKAVLGFGGDKILQPQPEKKGSSTFPVGFRLIVFLFIALLSLWIWKKLKEKKV